MDYNNKEDLPPYVKKLIKEIVEEYKKQNQKPDIKLFDLLSNIIYKSDIQNVNFWKNEDLINKFFDGFIPYILNKYSNNSQTINEKKNNLENYLKFYPISSSNIKKFIQIFSDDKIDDNIKSSFIKFVDKLNQLNFSNDEIDDNIQNFVIKFINGLDQSLFYIVREKIENNWGNESKIFNELNKYNIKSILSKEDVSFLLNMFKEIKNDFIKHSKENKKDLYNDLYNKTLNKLNNFILAKEKKQKAEGNMEIG